MKQQEGIARIKPSELCIMNDQLNAVCYDSDEDKNFKNMPKILESLEKLILQTDVDKTKKFCNQLDGSVNVLQPQSYQTLNLTDRGGQINPPVDSGRDEGTDEEVGKSNKNAEFGNGRTNNVFYLENRNFLHVKLGGFTYSALLDTGSSVSLVRSNIVESFKAQLQPTNNEILTATGEVSKCLATLNIQLDVDGYVGIVKFIVVDELRQDLILGMDFCEKWDLECKIAKRKWRVKEGKWRSFVGKEIKENAQVYAECAGLVELTTEQRQEVQKVSGDILSASKARVKLDISTKTEHSIDVQGTMPIRHAPRPMSNSMRQIAKTEVMKMSNDGIIEKSTSAWINAPVIVSNPEGTYKFFIDFRDLNAVTKKEAYPAEDVDAVLEKLDQAQYVTKINLDHTHCQIKLAQSSREYTAFSLPGSGTWQFKRLAFGLVNAATTFHNLFNELFDDECKSNVFLHLNDVLIATKTLEDHLKWLDTVLKKLTVVGLVIGVDKCSICCSKVTYSGYVLDTWGLRPDPERVILIQNFPTPQNVKQLERFLRIVSWYCRFIQDYQRKRIPLSKLTSKTQEWRWEQEQTNAFEAIKKCLTKAPVLATPDFNKLFCIQCDTSDYEIGAVLTQGSGILEHPVAYANRFLTSAETSYIITEKKCVNILWAAEKFKPYFRDNHFKLIADQAVVNWLRNLDAPVGRLAKWSLELQQYRFEIIERKTALQVMPDSYYFPGGKPPVGKPPVSKPPSRQVPAVPAVPAALVLDNDDGQQPPAKKKRIRYRKKKGNNDTEWQLQDLDYDAPVDAHQAPVVPCVPGADSEPLPVKLRGLMFGGLRRIPTDKLLDPPPYSCFNCWCRGHESTHCPQPPGLFCFNCGRRDVDLTTCPRCYEAHKIFARGRQMALHSHNNVAAPSSSAAPHHHQAYYHSQVTQQSAYYQPAYYSYNQTTGMGYDNTDLAYNAAAYASNHSWQAADPTGSYMQPTSEPPQRDNRWNSVLGNTEDNGSETMETPPTRNDVESDPTLPLAANAAKTETTGEKIRNVLQLLDSLKDMPQETRNIVLQSIYGPKKQ